MVLWKGKLTDQRVRPVWQRQYRARAEGNVWSCFDLLSRTKNWPLPCRHSPEREEREIPGHVWEQISGLGTGPYWKATFICLEGNYLWRKILTRDDIDVKGEWQFSKLSKATFHSFYSSSWSSSFNPNRTRNLFLLLLWFVSAQQAPIHVPLNHSQTRPWISLCSLLILSLPGRGLSPVSWHNADTGLLHLILVL